MTPDVAFRAYPTCGEEAKRWLRRLQLEGLLHGQVLEDAIPPCPPDHADKLLEVMEGAHYCERASLYVDPKVPQFDHTAKYVRALRNGYPIPNDVREVLGAYPTNWWYRRGKVRPEWL